MSNVMAKLAYVNEQRAAFASDKLEGQVKDQKSTLADQKKLRKAQKRHREMSSDKTITQSELEEMQGLMGENGIHNNWNETFNNMRGKRGGAVRWVGQLGGEGAGDKNKAIWDSTKETLGDRGEDLKADAAQENFQVQMAMADFTQGQSMAANLQKRLENHVNKGAAKIEG